VCCIYIDDIDVNKETLKEIIIGVIHFIPSLANMEKDEKTNFSRNYREKKNILHLMND